MQKTLIAALVLSLLVAACNGAGGGRPDPTQAYVGGNAGLEMGLIKGMPPATIFDTSSDGTRKFEFAIGVSLKNVGESPVHNTDNPYFRIALDGIRPAAFGLAPAQMVKGLADGEIILGARKNADGTIITGGINTITFDKLAYQERLQGNLVQQLGVNLCYDYTNRATVGLCFKDEILDRAQDLCVMTGEKVPQNSGGPIHITSLTENPISANVNGKTRVMINFMVEHVGTGMFFGRNKASGEEECNPIDSNLNKYHVEVEVKPQSSEITVTCSQLSTSAKGDMLLPSGAPMLVTCTLEAPIAGTRQYTEPLTIITRYRYGEMIATPIIIQAIG